MRKFGFIEISVHRYDFDSSGWRASDSWTDEQSLWIVSFWRRLGTLVIQRQGCERTRRSRGRSDWNSNLCTEAVRGEIYRPFQCETSSDHVTCRACCGCGDQILGSWKESDVTQETPRTVLLRTDVRIWSVRFALRLCKAPRRHVIARWERGMWLDKRSAVDERISSISQGVAARAETRKAYPGVTYDPRLFDASDDIPSDIDIVNQEMIHVDMREESDAVSEVLGLQKQTHLQLRDMYVTKVMIEIFDPTWTCVEGTGIVMERHLPKPSSFTLAWRARMEYLMVKRCRVLKETWRAVAKRRRHHFKWALRPRLKGQLKSLSHERRFGRKGSSSDPPPLPPPNRINVLRFGGGGGQSAHRWIALYGLGERGSDKKCDLPNRLTRFNGALWPPPPAQNVERYGFVRV